MLGNSFYSLLFRRHICYPLHTRQLEKYLFKYIYLLKNIYLLKSIVTVISCQFRISENFLKKLSYINVKLFYHLFGLILKSKKGRAIIDLLVKKLINLIFIFRTN